MLSVPVTANHLHEDIQQLVVRAATIRDDKMTTIRDDKELFEMKGAAFLWPIKY